MSVSPIPAGYHSITPYLIVRGGAAAIDYYQRAFGAEEMFRLDGPHGTVMHAELRIGDSIVMLADEMPQMDVLSPQARGGTSVSLMLYVPDVDAQFRQAIEAGGKEVKPVRDQFYGDRSGLLTDPFGHSWSLATHKEDVSHEELLRRAQAGPPSA